MPEFLLPPLVVLSLEPGDGLTNKSFEPGAVMGVERTPVEGLSEAVDLTLVEDTEGFQTGLQFIDLVGV